jgi:hypothetical protein
VILRVYLNQQNTLFRDEISLNQKKYITVKIFFSNKKRNHTSIIKHLEQYNIKHYSTMQNKKTTMEQCADTQNWSWNGA